SLSMLIERAVMAAFGYLDIPDVDDMPGDFLAAYGGPETPSAVTNDPDLIADDSQVPTVTPQADDDQGDPAIDDTAGADQAEPAALVDQGPDIPAQGPDIIPDCTGKTITLDERDKILVQVAEMLPGRKNSAIRIDMLNEKSVPVSLKDGKYRGQWDKKKFSNNLSLAKKRLGIK
ncbi:MAG: hypothetical protein LC657_19850, partial [Desulfobacteraceae bacterium]|nr:hypothetical protein [Desulfobacteraceae bacterium]